MDKQKALEQLEKEMEADTTLPLQESNLVFGEGNPDTDVLFIGEAPGKNEDIQRRPFVGQAGKLLDKMFDAIQWERSDIYITNIVKRRPPNNRDPFPEEIERYRPYLQKQIDIIQPRIIATLGRFSMNYFLPEAKISRDQGKLFWCDDLLIFPLYHPAAALRSGAMMETFVHNFHKLPIALKKFDSFLEEKKVADTL
jgi:DNA polymerase